MYRGEKEKEKRTGIPMLPFTANCWTCNLTTQRGTQNSEVSRALLLARKQSRIPNKNPPTWAHVWIDQGFWSVEVSVVPLSVLPSLTDCATSSDFRVSSQVQVLVLSPKEEDLLVPQLEEEETLGVAKNVGFSWPAMITRIFSSYGLWGFWSCSAFPSPASRSRSVSPFPSRYPESFQ